MATNTEKPTGKAEQKKAQVVQTPKADKKVLEKAPVKTEEKKTDKVENVKDKTQEKKKQPSKKVKKEFVVVNAQNVHVSTKYAINICRFIKGKRIGDAIRDLEDVSKMKKAVPMRGEYAHKKDVSIAGGAGKYPVNAAKQFIVLLKSLAGNANNHDVEEPIISEAIANKAPSPRGRFGRWERKRTHVKLVAKEMKINKEKKK